MVESTAAFGLVAGAVGVATTVPYARDTWRRTTRPHRGSWLIWSILEVISVEAQRADGARWSLVPLATQALGTLLILALSVRLGVGGLGRAELGLMAVAGAGVAGWLHLDEPVVATACVILADLMGVALMMPKTWRHPDSETLSTYTLCALCGALTVASVEGGHETLLAYPVYFTLVNAAVAVVIVRRRDVIARSRRLSTGPDADDGPHRHGVAHGSGAHRADMDHVPAAGAGGAVRDVGVGRDRRAVDGRVGSGT